MRLSHLIGQIRLIRPICPMIAGSRRRQG